MRTTIALLSLLIALVGVGVTGCQGTSDYDPDEHAGDDDGFFSIAQAHHRPDHDGGPDNNGNNTCEDDDDCDSGHGCTQGGQCIDITGEESVTEILQAEIEDLDEAVGMGVPYKLPANAILRIDEHPDHDGVGLLIENGVLLEGNGSRLMVENDVVGIRLGDDADWSKVSDLRIEPQNDGTVHEGIGIDVRAHGTRLQNLMIRMMGIGIRAHTNVEDEDLPRANVNTQQWSRIILRRNHEHGMHVRSGDSNAGLFKGIEVLGGGGIQDDSFLGNTYIAPVIQNDPELSSFEATSDAASTTTVGLYVEESAEYPVSSSLRDMHLGGNAIRRFVSPGGRVGGLGSQLRFSNAKHEDGHVGVAIPRGKHAPIAFSHGMDTDEDDNPHENAILEDPLGENGYVPGEEFDDDGPDDLLNSGEWRLMFSDSWNKWTIYDVARSRTYPFRWGGAAAEDDAGKFEVNTWLEEWWVDEFYELCEDECDCFDEDDD